MVMAKRLCMLGVSGGCMHRCTCHIIPVTNTRVMNGNGCYGCEQVCSVIVYLNMWYLYTSPIEAARLAK